MFGNPCYIDFDNLSSDTPGTYNSYMRYDKSAKEADFIVAKNVYADTGRSVKYGDGIVFSIIDKDSSTGVICMGAVPITSGGPTFVRLTIKESTTGSTLTISQWT